MGQDVTEMSDPAAKGLDGHKIPPRYSPTSIRFVSFNVNGVKTLKNYYPWNEHSGYDRALELMNADVISFQELKLQRGDIDASIANPIDYQSFITVPQAKKGYSGVGVFVRKPKPADPDVIRQALTVQRAEEGITGYLHMRGAHMSYRDCSNDTKYCDSCIGGYPSLTDSTLGRRLDSEGRCVLVELGIGLVVISVYCPANSMGTEEGEEFRLLFLQCLFERADYLQSQGKQVLIMGDINVSPDLIDSDEGISTGINQGLVKVPSDPVNFEALNGDAVIAFKKSTEPRCLLNSYLFDTTGSQKLDNSDKLLHDITRELQGRRLKMYTVWNTLKNTRPMNIGSRIDLFLATISTAFKQSDIWAWLYGSDHCPIYCDLEVQDPAVQATASKQVYSTKCNCKRMLAKNYYCVGSSRSIASFFQKRTAEPKEKQDEKRPKMKSSTTSSRPVYISRKKKDQPSLTDYISSQTYDQSTPLPTPSQTPSESQTPSTQSSLFVGDDEPEQAVPKKSTISAKEFRNLLQSVASTSCPVCKHQERCALRTVRDSRSKNVGKKFWCCARSTRTWDSTKEANVGSVSKSTINGIDEYNCGFFKWVSK